MTHAYLSPMLAEQQLMDNASSKAVAGRLAKRPQIHFDLSGVQAIAAGGQTRV